MKILVCCFTNHALDQFLEDLMDIGIPQSSLVRLGGKSSKRTEPLSLYNQKSGHRFGRNDWAQVDALKTSAADAHDKLQNAFAAYQNLKISARELLEYLDTAEPEFHYAFRVEVQAGADGGGMRRVGRRGRAVGETYLLDQWSRGWDAGVLRDAANVRETPGVWAMPAADRRARVAEWQDAIVREHVEALADLGKIFNGYQERLAAKFAETDLVTLLGKRVIGCTTTAAAKYSEQLRQVLPEVVIVEEAGEILESHVLTALGEETRRLVLIGDHK